MKKFLPTTARLATTLAALATTTIKAEPTMREINSPRQAGTTRVYVLAPDKIEPGKKYPVLYMLPVEAEDNSHFGNPLVEARALDLANRHQVFCVYPTFSEMPWFADHPKDPKKAQESYFIKEVIPFVEANYPVLAERSGRYLVGFSKSGWGVFSLLLRNPGLFEKAASFDAPLTQEKVGPWGSGLIFGDQQTFDAYRPDLLFRKHAAEYRDAPPRFVLMGSVLFKKHTDEAYALLRELGIPHRFLSVQNSRHHWKANWLEKAAEMLFDESPLESPAVPGGTPDLTIAVAAANLAANPKTIRVVVSNIGNGDVEPGATISVTAYDRATPPRVNYGFTITRDGLAAGAKTTLAIPLANLPETLPETFCVVVDDRNRITESDKTNNSALVFPKP